MLICWYIEKSLPKQNHVITNELFLFACLAASPPTRSSLVRLADFCCFNSTCQKKARSVAALEGWRYHISHSEPIKPHGFELILEFAGAVVLWHGMLRSHTFNRPIALSTCANHRNCWEPWAGRPPSRASGPPLFALWNDTSSTLLRQTPRSYAQGLRGLETLRILILWYCII